MTSKQHRTAVYYLSLQLQNVRCFGKQQTLDLRGTSGELTPWTLLLGNNGVGKTTLLQCLNWMRPVPYPEEQPAEEQPAEVPPKVQPALTSAENAALSSLLRDGEKDVLLDAAFGKGRTFRTASKPSIRTGIHISANQDKLDDLELTQNTGQVPPVPTIFGYSANRHMGLLNLDGSERVDQSATLVWNAWDSTELFDAAEILERLDYAAGKKRPQANVLLEKIKEALVAILPDIQTSKNIRMLGPNLGSDSQNSGVRFQTQYGDVPLSALSLGYQTVTGLALDIAWRLIQQNPRHPSPLAQPAIVLIDEIDLHLHPLWQRQIMSTLSLHFPAVQFIATAHSPLMVDANPQTNLAVLSEHDGEVLIENKPQAVEGWRVDQILTSALFGLDTTRAPQVQALLQERQKILAKKRTTSGEKGRLAEIEARLDELPTAEKKEDQEAMDLIRRAAALVQKRQSRR